MAMMIMAMKSSTASTMPTAAEGPPSCQGQRRGLPVQARAPHQQRRTQRSGRTGPRSPPESPGQVYRAVAVFVHAAADAQHSGRLTATEVAGSQGNVRTTVQRRGLLVQARAPHQQRRTQRSGQTGPRSPPESPGQVYSEVHAAADAQHSGRLTATEVAGSQGNVRTTVQWQTCRMWPARLHSLSDKREVAVL